MKWRIQFVCPAKNPNRQVEGDFFIELPFIALTQTWDPLFGTLLKARLNELHFFQQGVSQLEWIERHRMSVSFWRLQRLIVIAFDCDESQNTFRTQNLVYYKPRSVLRQVLALGLVPVGVAAVLLGKSLWEKTEKEPKDKEKTGEYPQPKEETAEKKSGEIKHETPQPRNWVVPFKSDRTKYELPKYNYAARFNIQHPLTEHAAPEGWLIRSANQPDKVKNRLPKEANSIIQPKEYTALKMQLQNQVDSIDVRGFFTAFKTLFSIRNVGHRNETLIITTQNAQIEMEFILCHSKCIFTLYSKNIPHRKLGELLQKLKTVIPFDGARRTHISQECDLLSVDTLSSKLAAETLIQNALEFGKQTT